MSDLENQLPQEPAASQNTPPQVLSYLRPTQDTGGPTAFGLLEGTLAGAIASACLLGALGLIWLCIRANSLALLLILMPLLAMLGIAGFLGLRHAWLRFRGGFPHGL